MKGREALQLGAECPGPPGAGIVQFCRVRLKTPKCAGGTAMWKGQGVEYVAYHWAWAEYISECGDPSDQSVPAYLVLRQEPDEEEEEDEDDSTKDDDGDRDDNGYSESVSHRAQ